MCGKFTQMASWRDVVEFSQPLTGERDYAVTATPMRFATIVRLDESGARKAESMLWGFADWGAKGPIRPKHMHARGETIDEKPTFARAFAQARGVLYVSTFNEGEELANGRTQQWTITPKDGKPIAIAVIYEIWERGDERAFAFVQATTPANKLISKITDRMPAILSAEDVPVWLGETGAPLADIKALLRTYEDGGAWEMAREQKKPRGRERQPDLF